MKYWRECLIVSVCVAIVAKTAVADTQEGTDSNVAHIYIHPLYTAKNGIDTETGSSTYTFNRDALANLPNGEFARVSDVLLHAPGVAQDSYGQLHVRGDHADLQYRINGIILPEGISGFGQTLDTHIIDKVDLLTGALPAEYGYRTAGVVNITTKTENIDNGGRSALMFGSNNTLEANQEYYGSAGNTNYFFNGTYASNNRGIEPPTGAGNAIHDYTTQDKEFAYLSHTFNPYNRFSFIFGNSTNRFEIPNNPGQPQNFTLNGAPSFSSSSLDERQFEHNTYAIGALQGAVNDDTDYQLALFTRYSSVLYKPDQIGDLIFNGIAARDYRDSLTTGLQNDFSYHATGSHTIRTGWSASYEQAQSNTNSSVFAGFFDPVSGQVIQNAGAATPFNIIENSSQPARLLGLYLQDEWKITDKFIVNYGLRFDYYSAYVTDNQLSPRIGMVYDLTPHTRLHAGYARYFTPPPTELIAPVAIQRFVNTTGATASTNDTLAVPEKDNYFDAGVIQKFGDNLAFGVDAYYKQARHLLDEGQFGQALIFAPFNYANGWVRGVEFTGDYKYRAFSAYANLAISKAMGKTIESGQYNFGPDKLSFIAGNAVHLDHDQLISGSLGASYNFHDVIYSADMIYGSGLRDGFANTGHLPFYAQVNFNAGHSFDFGGIYGIVDSKFTIINLLDRVYEIRNGSGIGVFAPQYAQRRGFFLELSKPF